MTQQTYLHKKKLMDIDNKLKVSKGERREG